MFVLQPHPKSNLYCKNTIIKILSLIIPSSYRRLTNITNFIAQHNNKKMIMASIKKSTTLLTVALFLFLQFFTINGHGGADHDSDNENTNLRAKGLILVKVYCLIIMFVSTFAGGVSPYFYRWNESFLLLGTQFAGGVFLGTSLMHFLSDSAAKFAVLTEKEYPFSFMLASAGYLLLLFFLN